MEFKPNLGQRLASMLTIVGVACIVIPGELGVLVPLVCFGVALFLLEVWS
jgi:hypothetical protein